MFIYMDRLFDTGLLIPPGDQRGGGPYLITGVIEGFQPSILELSRFPRGILDMICIVI